MKKKNPGAVSPISLRIADDLRADLEEAGRKLKMDTHQVMRLAMELGLEHFMRIDYNLAKSLIDASIEAQTKRTQKTSDESQLALVAETPADNVLPLPPRQATIYESGNKKTNKTGT